MSKVDLRPQCGMPCSKLEVSTAQHGTLSGAGYLHQSRRPLGKGFYFGGERLAAFGHMSGLLARTGSAGPDEVRRPSAPDQGGFGLLTHCGVSDGLRSSRRVVHHVVVALAKLLSLRSPFECVAPDWDQALA